MRLTIFLLMFFCAMASASDQKLAEKKLYVVGFAQDTLANDWRKTQVKHLQEAFSQYPHIKLVVTNAEGSSARQIRQIEDMANQNFDVIITSPRDGVASTPAISRIYKQGIPVVLVTRKIATDDYTSLIGPDDYQIGMQAAAYIAQQLKGKGHILMLKGVPTATTAMARTRGFLDVIEKYDDIKVVSIKTANYLRADAIKATEEVLKDGVAFDAVYAQSDSMATGARLALERAGISPRDKLIVGVDYIQEAREAIRNKEQSASFLYPISAQQVADVVVAILNNQPVPKRVVVKSTVITLDNVELVEPIF